MFLIPYFGFIIIIIIPKWFQQDGSPAHFSMRVGDWLKLNIPNWIGRRGYVAWSPCSPNLGHLDFFFWSMLEEKVHPVYVMVSLS